MRIDRRKVEELSTVLYMGISARLQLIAADMSMNAKSKSAFEAALCENEHLIRRTCLELYEDAHEDFKVFLEVLIDALLWMDWKNKSWKRFTINFSRELGSTVRYALRKKRAAAEAGGRADDKAEKTKR